MPPIVHGSSLSLDPIIEEEDVESREALLINKKLKSVLHRGVERYLSYESVVLPKNTLKSASSDIVNLSVDQPGGLRGAVVDLHLDDNGCLKRLAQIVADPRHPVKTVIKLTLHKVLQPSDPNTLHLHSGYAIERCCKP
ncbi:hypothetical protein SK128_013298 [Halocaridina rubra]|uniref:Uncharacterized protein n=1 Tax=Halocaridina rubra TaxID=373956 RepID=A0AAN9AHC1_HALRR